MCVCAGQPPGSGPVHLHIQERFVLSRTTMMVMTRGRRRRHRPIVAAARMPSRVLFYWSSCGLPICVCLKANGWLDRWIAGWLVGGKYIHNPSKR